MENKILDSLAQAMVDYSLDVYSFGQAIVENNICFKLKDVGYAQDYFKNIRDIVIAGELHNLEEQDLLSRLKEPAKMLAQFTHLIN